MIFLIKNIKDFNFKQAILVDKNGYFIETLTLNNNKQELKQKILKVIFNMDNLFHDFSDNEIKQNKEMIEKEILKNKFQVVVSIEKMTNEELIYKKETLNEYFLIEFLFKDFSYLDKKKQQKNKTKSHNGISKSFTHYMEQIDIENFKTEILLMEKVKFEKNNLINEYDYNFNNDCFKKMNRLNKLKSNKEIPKQTKKNTLGWKSKNKKHQYEKHLK